MTDFTEDNRETSPQHDESLERTPLLCLDVNLGHGVSPQIVIYEGDDPVDVANRFVLEYGKFHPFLLTSHLELGEVKRQRLIEAIKVQLMRINT